MGFVVFSTYLTSDFPLAVTAPPSFTPRGSCPGSLGGLHKQFYPSEQRYINIFPLQTLRSPGLAKSELLSHQHQGLNPIPHFVCL